MDRRRYGRSAVGADKMVSAVAEDDHDGHACDEAAGERDHPCPTASPRRTPGTRRVGGTERTPLWPVSRDGISREICRSHGSPAGCPRSRSRDRLRASLDPANEFVHALGVATRRLCRVELCCRHSGGLRLVVGCGVRLVRGIRRSRPVVGAGSAGQQITQQVTGSGACRRSRRLPRAWSSSMCSPVVDDIPCLQCRIAVVEHG